MIEHVLDGLPCDDYLFGFAILVRLSKVPDKHRSLPEPEHQRQSVRRSVLRRGLHTSSALALAINKLPSQRIKASQ